MQNKYTKRCFKIRQELEKYITYILQRRGIDYKVCTINGSLMIETNLSGEAFHKVVIRAMCEKQDFERNPSGIVEVPMVHCSELNNKQVMDWVDGRPHIVIVERYK